MGGLEKLPFVGEVWNFLELHIVFLYGSLISEEFYNLNWMAVQTAIRAYLCFYSMDKMPVHRRVTPSIKFSAIHLYNWVERSITRVLVKCLAQEHNVVTPAKTFEKGTAIWSPPC